MLLTEIHRNLMRLTYNQYKNFSDTSRRMPISEIAVFQKNTKRVEVLNEIFVGCKFSEYSGVKVASISNSEAEKRDKFRLQKLVLNLDLLRIVFF